MLRKIVRIDEEKCDGCGDCIPACEEGAIRLEGGKARLADDMLCDGLGACLGECPRGAITIIEREAAAFDEEAVARRLGKPHHAPKLASVRRLPEEAGCPGSRAMSFGAAPAAPTSNGRPRLSVLTSGPSGAAASPPRPAVGGSRLGQWPIQLHLVSTGAPYFQGADLLVAADCVPFAYARFHEDLLAGRRVVVGCPKLDDNRFYTEKLTELLQRSGVRSVTVAKMEVPCCGGIAWAARQAVRASGRAIPFREVTVGIHGDLVDEGS